MATRKTQQAEALAREITRLCGHIRAATPSPEFDRTEGWAGAGCRSGSFTPLGVAGFSGLRGRKNVCTGVKPGQKSL